MLIFNLDKPFWLTLLRAPADDGGGGDGGDGGDDTAAGGGGDDTAAGGGGDDTATGGGGDDGPKWYEDKRFDDATQTQLKALGLTVDDPLDAVQSLTAMERAAKAKLGKPAGSLIEKPGEGKDLGEWLRENGEALGIPDKPEGYEVKPPEGWPKEQDWDADFEGEARKIAHEEGITGKALQRLTDLYAGKIGGLMGGAEADLAASQAEMMAALQKDWGDQTSARIAQVQQISSVLAEHAGLDDDAMVNLASVLKPKIGDANTIRLFAAVAEMAGEDMAVALKGGGGGGAMTPAEALARIEDMKKPDSDYNKARIAAQGGRNRTDFEKLQAEWTKLNKIAAGK